jgi:anti-sigma factor RsiW
VSALHSASEYGVKPRQIEEAIRWERRTAAVAAWLESFRERVGRTLLSADFGVGLGSWESKAESTSTSTAADKSVRPTLP